ncbi:proteasome activator complex subunit 4A-like [Paramacrobiotus metropolitanus]|uniref:proteasome activator complex subunit 4A-like n=1 Tax=Paramacrobiotus metropolitanus TaxID=2943436 RepID=UPI00244606FC|nr:proteasome activator complex subunit 4A-like [Paramacrobiotus metropolitanus]XP_055341642.1 proteasome activator complex subunit 4A-like [Paramacrobiotus metropolitanus]
MSAEKTTKVLPENPDSSRHPSVRPSPARPLNMETDAEPRPRTSAVPLHSQVSSTSDPARRVDMYNRFLAYPVDAEADAWFAETKANLAKCLLEADYRPGLFFWTTRLEAYVALYGRRFSKADHVLLVEMYLALLLDPDMEPSLVSRFAKVVALLLRKLELLKPEDLTIEWRPLYKLFQRVHPSTDQLHGVFYWPEKLDDKLRELIGFCRYYFPLSATQEMLDEFRPMLCPFDDQMSTAMDYLSMFLPTMLKPHQAQYGYELWLEEFLNIWLAFHGVPAWEMSMLQLFSRAAAENIGYIQWEKYVAAIFTKFLRTLELPVGKKQLQLVYSNDSFDESSAVLWPVAMIHNEKCLQALEVLFRSVESYFHPSNYGNWTDKLSQTLMFLPMGMVARLQLERFRPKDWMPEIPPEACLSDDTVRRFVRAFKPLALLNLFNKSAPEEAAIAIQQLALLAPEEIFPDLLDKFYSSVENMVEPLRFQAIVAALSASLPFLFNYKDGRKHVVPLMLALLPGIDSNDVRKTVSTLGFFSTIATMIPLRPCYDQADSAQVTSDDREVCGQTAEFENILLQLLDKCLAMLDNFAVEPGARTDHMKGVGLEANMEEKIVKMRMEMLWFAILTQVDDNTAQLLADKLYSAASSRIYPVQQLGASLVSYMCTVVMRLRPEIGKTRLLHACIRLLEIRLAERDNVMDLTNLDDELLWSLKLVGDVVASSGKHVLDYVDRIRSILRQTLMMKCNSGHRYACIIARAVLITLLRTYPINYYEAPEKIFPDFPAKLSTLDLWGKRVQPEDVHVQWYVPEAQTVAVCAGFFQEFASEALDLLNQYASGGVSLEDKKIQKCLHVLEATLVGVISHCGFDFDEMVALPGYDLTYPQEDLPKISGTKQEEILLNGQPVRKVLAETLQRVVERVLMGHQDETKSLKSVLVLYKIILLSRGPSPEDVMLLGGTLSTIKNELQNRLSLKKSRFRMLYIEKARMQHELRGVYQRASRMTATRVAILKVIVRLAVSRYKEVRSNAQTLFAEVTGQLNLAYRYVLPDILHYLADSKSKTDDNDAQLKGCLYLILGSKNLSLLLKHDWDTIRRVVPAVVEAQHSENATVSLLFDALSEKVETMFITTGLVIKPAVDVAVKVATEMLGLEIVFEQALKIGQQKLEVKNANNLRLYVELVEHLVQLLNAPQIRLKNFLIGQVFLSYFIRNDVLPPLRLVQFTLEHLLDSNDKARRTSLLMMISIMRALKPPRKKIRIEPCHDLNNRPLPLPTTIGIREDNLWVCVDETRIPTAEADYDNTVFIDKIWPGYYGWPKSGLMVSAPAAQQSSWQRTRDQMKDVELLILDKLTDEQWVAALIKFLAAEDFAHAEFDQEHFMMFRGWFRHFNKAVVPLFLQHLQQLVKSREEHSQRAAAEIMTALIRGSKRWPYRMVSKLWADLAPLIQTALNNISGETLPDWIAFGTNSIGYGDMRQIYPLLRSVLILSPTDTGFQTSSKLAVIHGIFECSDWRRRNLHYMVLEMLESRLTDSYRDHVAYLLSVAFRHDINLPHMDTRQDQGPKATDFFNKYFATCLSLLEDEGHTTLQTLILFKTIVKAIVTHVSSLATLRPDVLRYYPLLCRFENDTRDADLAKDCISALTCFSQVFLSENAIPRLLSEVHAVVTKPDIPWRARVVALDNLQVCIFNNLLTILERPLWIQDIAALVRQRLLDEQVEVRQMAAVTLTGLFQCQFLPMSPEELGVFQQWANLQLPRGADKTSPEYLQTLIRRHAGVLGLSACIAAHPYDVPAFVPNVLMALGEHINDPLPISQTVRATFGEFRRTHHDSWREHKEKFSDDQLAILTDLLVSPNYYA